MILAPGVTVAAVHSTTILEDGAELSVWLSLSNGATIACHLPLSELITRGHVIEEAGADEACAGQSAAVVIERIARGSKNG